MSARFRPGSFLNSRNLLVLFALLARTALVHAGSYTVTDLGDLGGGFAYATGINSSGTVVGYSTTQDNAIHAFAYSNGTMHDLGTLGGSYSYAYGINDAGVIVGSSYVAGDAGQHAFTFSNGTMQDLGTLGGSQSYAYAVNNAGTVVGSSYTANDYLERAFAYSNGTMEDLGALSLGGGIGGSRAFGINESGTIVGISGDGTAFHGFSYSNGTMQDLGTLGGLHSAAYAINEAGTIAGIASTGPGSVMAINYSDTIGLLNLGYSAKPAAINEAGTMVGFYADGLGWPHPFVLIDGVPVDLNLLVEGMDVYLTEATALNDSGQIAVNSYFPAVQGRAFLLTPGSGSSTGGSNVPEGGVTFLLLLATCAAITTIRQLRRCEYQP